MTGIKNLDNCGFGFSFCCYNTCREVFTAFTVEQGVVIYQLLLFYFLLLTSNITRVVCGCAQY